MKSDVLYVLPRWDYFQKGRSGDVMHALGVASGLAANGVRVIVTSGVMPENIKASLCRGIHFEELPRGGHGRWAWTHRLVSELDKIIINKRPGTVLVRYSVLAAPLFKKVIARHPGIHWGFEVNSLAFHQLHTKPYWMRRMFLKVETTTLRHVNFIYVVSRELKMQLLRAMPYYDPERIIVCPNAGPEPLLVGKNRGLDEGATKFAYLGMLHSYYDLGLMVKAFRKLKKDWQGPLSLNVFGDGAQSKELQRLARGERAIRLHGRYDGVDSLLCDGLLNQQTILILPYSTGGLTAIGSPIKLFEYMALGLPIIASDVGQPGVILNNGVTARLYKAGSKGALVQAMRWMLDHPKQRKLMAERMALRYANEHTWSKRMRYLYEEIQRGKTR